MARAWPRSPAAPSHCICHSCSATFTLAYFVLVVVFPSQAAAKLAVQLAAAFEPHQHQQFARILQKATNDVNGDPRFNFTLVGLPLSVSPTTPAETIRKLCDLLDQTNVTGLVVFAERPHTFAAATVAGYSGLPIVGASQGYADFTFKDVSPLLVALNPSLDHVADAVCHLLVANHWHTSTFLGDESVTSVQLWARLRTVTERTPWTRLSALTVPRSPKEVADMLSDAAKMRGRVLLLHCDRERAQHVFQEARKQNMVEGDWIWILLHDDPDDDLLPEEYFPTGLLALQLRPLNITKHVVRAAVRLFALGLRDAGLDTVRGFNSTLDAFNCWFAPSPLLHTLSMNLNRAMQSLASEIVSGRETFDGGGERIEGVLNAHFDILNLRPGDVEGGGGGRHWRLVGNVTAGRVQFDAVTWPGDLAVGPHPTANALLRVVSAIAPPFVMETTLVENRTCLKGVPCLRVTTNNTAELAVIAAEFRADRDLDPNSSTYNVTCCFGHSIDLLMSISSELQFDYVLYLVHDGHFGGKRGGTWNGIVADLISGAAHLSLAPLSVTSVRAAHVDFSVPYFYSGVKFLTSYKQRDIPLHAFLLTFSPYLWIAIFASLNTTAMAAAVYEWLSPFGLNPWGRQRTKNFSIASALWVMWSLLFSHLVAFKAPKSWPNKVLINLWGCFSVIFLASYTANIARLFAGLFFQSNVNNFHDIGLLSQRVGAVRSSSSETYVSKSSPELWQHMAKYTVFNLEEGVRKLKAKELDWLVGDTPILDYYRNNDPGCLLESMADILNEDSYAIGMPKGSPFKDPISRLVTRYNENGYLDYVNDKWFTSSPCNRREVRPVRLNFGAVAGVFIMLGVGILVGCLILVFEHLVFKHALPNLRKKPKGSKWRSPNLMFLSQKLYRFINCVELVSPHHSAKELVNNLRTGQITSLFQKSVKRKEHEQRRRRKSKAQFFEMIQEIRRVQKEGKEALGLGLRELRKNQQQINEEMSEEEDKEVARSEATAARRCSAVPERTHSHSHPHPHPHPHSHSHSAYFSDDSCTRLILHTPGRLGDSEDMDEIDECGQQDEEDDDDDDDDDRCYDSDSDAVARFSPISTSLNDLSPYGPVYGDREGDREGYRDGYRDSYYECTAPGPSCTRGKTSRVRSFDDLQLLTASLPPPSSSSSFHAVGVPDCGSGSGCGSGSSSAAAYSFMREVSASLDFGAHKLDERRLRRLTKEDVLLLWQSSERHLRKRLLHALQEKAQLETKLAVFQRALLHPP